MENETSSVHKELLGYMDDQPDYVRTYTALESNLLVFKHQVIQSNLHLRFHQTWKQMRIRYEHGNPNNATTSQE